MNTPVRRRLLVAASIASIGALALAGCTSDSGSGDGSSDASGEKITLTISTFNDFGYTDELFAEYEADHPDVEIVHTRAATSNEARENYFQKLGKTGLSDIEAIEIDWLPEVMKYSDLLAPVDSGLRDRWEGYVVEPATDADGNIIGYGTDTGPEAVCYRGDLFEAAGLPSDPAEVATLLDGDWANYFSVGQQYVDATGKAWFDAAGSIYQGMVNQFANAYEENDGTIIATTNPEIKDSYDQLLAASATESAKLGQWSDDWYAGMANGDFATILCPGWMLTQIEGNAEGVTGWNIADVFPNGGGNWGGSYLTVPANGEHVAQAQELADWLTSPEILIKTFENAGNVPSASEALVNPTFLAATNEFFNDAPIGEIFSARAKAVTVTPFKGESYFQINDSMQKALTRVEEGTQDATTSWNQWVDEVNAIG